MKRTLSVLLALGLVTGFAVLVSQREADRHPSAPNAQRILAAVQSYADTLRTQGRALPRSVLLQELVDRGWVSTDDLGPFADWDVRIYLTAQATRPQDPLMEARLPDGTTAVTLADGSVQLLASR